MTDGGVGMSDEVKERLFEPFFTTKEVGKGTGLGMATVYGSIRQMGGQIEVDSAQGRGTTVRVLLPSVEQAATRERRETPLDETVRGAGETVLVVDDDAAVRKAVARMLSQNGYRVVQAEGPGEALLIAERDTAAIDVLLTDLAMPLMPGPELANRVRLLAPSVRVIFMTGFASPRELRNAVADAPLVRKPMQADELARAVRRAFERS